MTEGISEIRCISEAVGMEQDKYFFNVLLTVHPNIIRVFFFHQLDAQILYFNTFIVLLYMFLTLLCSSSEAQIVLVWNLESNDRPLAV